MLRVLSLEAETGASEVSTSEGELDLGGIPSLLGRLLEVGRTCIAPQYRQGSTIAVLWSALAGFIYLHGIDFDYFYLRGPRMVLAMAQWRRG